MAKLKVHNPLELGNDYGHLKFGHINMNNQLSGIMLRNGLPGQEVEHYMTMISSGAQKGGTINRCPGVYQIHCGERPVTNNAFILNAAEGDIVIRAARGRVRIEGQDIDLHANKGIINLDSNEKINMKSKTIEINGDSVVKFFSSGLLELIGQNTINFWGGLIDCADGATTGLPSKGESLLEDQQREGGLDG